MATLHENKCNICKEFLVVNDDYDALFCPNCNYWIEGKCGDNDCTYCMNRPEYPLPNT